MDIVSVYVTRHCLSKGIRLMQGTVVGDTFVTKEQGVPYEANVQDWFINWEEAVKRARRLQKDKVRSLRRYADRIESLTFDQTTAE